MDWPSALLALLPNHMGIGSEFVANVRNLMPEVRTLFSVGAIGRLTDNQLLARSTAPRGESSEQAFAALVERHGPMVLRVCRGILRDPGDVDDAFQATFVVLARQKRGALWVRDSIGPWLYGVACRVATRALADAARRQRHERKAAKLASASSLENDWNDCAPILLEEVDRLPERLRAPLVLCYLEGLTHDQAAEHLGCPVGTIRSRLSRGRDQLRARLERRGVVHATPLAAFLSLRSPKVPSTLVHATIGMARVLPSNASTILGAKVVRAMFWHRLMRVGATALLIGIGASALGGAAVGGLKAQTRNMPRVARVPTVAPALPLVPAKSEAERIAEEILKAGSDLFDAKDAASLATTYSLNGEIHLIESQKGKYNDRTTQGRIDIESFYREMFKDAGEIDSENHVDHAQLIADNVLLIHGRFRPTIGEQERPFTQLRIKEGEDWLITKLWLFLASEGEQTAPRIESFSKP